MRLWGVARGAGDCEGGLSEGTAVGVTWGAGDGEGGLTGAAVVAVAWGAGDCEGGLPGAAGVAVARGVDACNGGLPGVPARSSPSWVLDGGDACSTASSCLSGVGVAFPPHPTASIASKVSAIRGPASPPDHSRHSLDSWNSPAPAVNCTFVIGQWYCINHRGASRCAGTPRNCPR